MIVLTLVLVLITGKYAYHTRKLVISTQKYTKLTKELVDNANKPQVIAYLLQNDIVIRGTVGAQSFGEMTVNTTFCIENVGTGVARNINFGKNLTFAPYGGEPLEKISFFKKGIPLLPPGKQIRHSRMNRISESVDISQIRVDIDIIYQDLQDKEYSNTFTLDFSQSDFPQDHPQ